MNATDIDPTTDEELLRIRSQFMPSAYLLHHPIVAEAASGAWLTDASGRQYIDFAGGIAVVNVGHRDAQVVEAVREQLTRLIHSGPVTANRPSIELARRLSLLVGPDREMQTLFINSGAEATENAMKVARHATGRTHIVGFDRAFHGRAWAAAAKKRVRAISHWPPDSRRQGLKASASGVSHRINGGRIGLVQIGQQTLSVFGMGI